MNLSLEGDLTLTLLGVPRWSRGVGVGGPLSRKDALLLALLALDGELPRDRVAAWLWPDASPQRGHGALRQRLFKLRQVTRHPLVVAGQTLCLAAGVVADACQAEPALQGELLGGHDYGDLEAADGWLLVQRQRLQNKRLDQRVGRAAQLEATGAWAAAIELCEEIVVVAPTHEHTWRRLMRLHYLRADRSSAIQTFERLENNVLAEQGSRPSAETLELLRAIEALNPPRSQVPQLLPASLVQPPLMVGRAGAIQALQQAWQIGHAVLVLGSGGVGKSRLLAEFMPHPGPCLHTRARPGDEALPYAVLCPLLQQTLAQFEPAPGPALQAELSRLLPALGPPPPGTGQQATLWQAVETLLAHCVQRGLKAWVVDDLHFADQASLELLRWLYTSPRLVGLRFAFAARPDEPGAAGILLNSWGGDSSRLELLRLLPLSQAEVGELVRSLQLPALDQAGPDFAQALYRHAGGHPFFTLETIKASVQQGFAPDAHKAFPKPAAVKTMIERRLARLSAPAQDVLRLAAVVGVELNLRWVAAVLRRPTIELAGSWAELEAAQVMLGPGFAHDLVREAALDSVPIPLRSALHGEWAQVLQASGGVEPARLAHHWWEAGVWPSAATALSAAADAARVAGRLQEQEELLQRASQAHHRAGDATASFVARCDALAVVMMRLGSEATLQRLPALLDEAQSKDQRARAHALQAEALLNLARYGEALDAAKASMAGADDSGLVAFDAASLYARALALNGQPAQAVEGLQRSCASAWVLNDPARRLVVQAALAHAQFAAGQVGASVASQRLAFELAERLGDGAEIAQTAGNLATLATAAGDVVTAYRFAAEAEKRFHAMGADQGHGVFNRLILARSAAHLARIDEALPLLQSAAELNAGQVGETSLTLARVALGVMKLWLGRPDEALPNPPPQSPAVHPLAMGSWYLLQARVCHQLGMDPEPPCQAFDGLALRHPELADNPVLCLEWARFAPLDAALSRLRRLRDQARQAGADGMARSLALRELVRLLDIDAGAAHPLAAHDLAMQLEPEMQLGLYPSTYPPEAWWAMAMALQAHAPLQAQTCLMQARRWIDEIRLPQPRQTWLAPFLNHNPVNRRVLALPRGSEAQLR